MTFYVRLFSIIILIMMLFLIWGFSMKVKTYFFSDMEAVGTVINVQNPIGETQHYVYKVKYIIDQKEYFISNNYPIDESYRIGDNVMLIIDKNDYSEAIFKGYISWSIIAIILSILFIIIFFNVFLSTFNQNNVN